MTINKIIEKEVYGTESGKKLFKLLKNLKDDKRAI